MAFYDFLCMICTSDSKNLYFEMNDSEQMICDCGNQREKRFFSEKINARMDQKTNKDFVGCAVGKSY